MAYKDEFLSVAGCKAHVMRGGAGGPLLYLHGASGAPVWQPFMEKLAETHEVIVVEHPGFGQSEHPAWLDSMSDLAYFYLDLIDQLGLKNIDLLGGSIGGWLALEIAIRDSSKLRSIGLIAPAGIHVKGLRKADIFMWSPQETARNLFHDQSYAEAILAAPSTPESLLTMLQNRLTTAKLAWQPRLHNPDLPKWLHRIKVPTLIVWGDEDKIIPPAYGPHFAQLIPGARLETIPAVGHLPQTEKPEQFVGIYNRFIEEIAR